jgi:hypothetical protein
MGGIPFDPALAQSADAGYPFVLNHAETLAGKAFMQLAATVQCYLQTLVSAGDTA